MRRAVVRGSGLSALCAASLLARRGVQVDLVPQVRAALPAIVIGAATIAILREIVEDAAWPASIHRLRARSVDWSGGAPAIVEEDALVAGEAELLAALRASIDRRFGDRVRTRAAGDPSAEITIYAAGRIPAKSYRFGGRRISWQIVDEPPEDPAVSHMSSDTDGWTFRTPLHSGAVLAQRVALGQSAGQPCAPRIHWPPYGPGWFACGPAAIMVDPICGDGAGYAARSAVWLCGLLGAHGVSGLAEVEANYSRRLAMAFHSHLASCLGFYSTARFAQRWEKEIASTRRGAAAMAKLLAQMPPMSCALAGFDAAPLSAPGDQTGPTRSAPAW